MSRNILLDLPLHLAVDLSCSVGQNTRRMKHQFSVLLLAVTVAATGLFSSCSYTDYNRIPRTDFIQHYQKVDDPRCPFVSGWDCQTSEEWDRAIAGKRTLYVKPVTLTYFHGKVQTEDDARHIEALRDYFDRCLHTELEKAAKNDPNLTVAYTPTAGAWTMEVAILSARSVNVAKNAVVTGLGQAVGAGKVWDMLLNKEEESKGYVSMGCRLTNPSGKITTEVADFEYGMGSLTGVLLVDTKDFRPYAYQRATVAAWAEHFAKLVTTPAETGVSRRQFSLNPF